MANRTKQNVKTADGTVISKEARQASIQAKKYNNQPVMLTT
jgi:hypothetical protein